MGKLIFFMLIACCSLPFQGVAAADEASETFYKGKTITLTIGAPSGGSYDLYARLIARYMPRYIFGDPIIIAKNLPGAGGITAAQRLARTAPKDGTEFATTLRGAIIMPVLGLASGFDPSQYTWIGSADSETAVCLVWHTNPVKTFKDALKHELVMGSAAKGADVTGLLPPLVKLLGAKFKIVHGYEGGASLDLAMSRGEIDGRCGVSWGALSTEHSDWLRDRTVNIILQLGFKPRAELAGIPMAQDFVKSAEDRTILDLLLSPQQIAYPYFAPSNVPLVRARALRDAFEGALSDMDLIKEAKSMNLEINFTSSIKIEKMLQEIYAKPSNLIARARVAVE